VIEDAPEIRRYWTPWLGFSISGTALLCAGDGLYTGLIQSTNTAFDLVSAACLLVFAYRAAREGLYVDGEHVTSRSWFRTQNVGRKNIVVVRLDSTYPRRLPTAVIDTRTGQHIWCGGLRGTGKGTAAKVAELNEILAGSDGAPS
jgi:hypothetical protein